jgi:2-phospho-L-lactate guanylyltransferase
MRLTVLPIRSFDGLTRLSAVIDAEARRDLIARLAARAIGAARLAGSEVVVVTGDSRVASWATAADALAVAEPDGGGLDGAAGSGIAMAAGGPWLVLHADLPCVGRDDVEAVFAAARDRFALAPSRDGGTSAVAGAGPAFPFRYGPGSFRRHLAAVRGRAAVVTRPGLAADIDRPVDLERLGLIDRLGD